jgi:hypothetical protein
MKGIILAIVVLPRKLSDVILNAAENLRVPLRHLHLRAVQVLLPHSLCSGSSSFARNDKSLMPNISESAIWFLAKTNRRDFALA